MISTFGKYIPLIFLITVLLVIMDSLVSTRQVMEIQNDYQQISQTYQNLHEKLHISFISKERNSLEEKRALFFMTISHMYSIIILTALLSIVLLIFAYIAIMRELKQRTLLEQKKNDFISLASHELKTPITSMSIFTEILANRISPSDKQTMHILFRMTNQVTEMKNLINDLLDITRIQLGKLDLKKESFSLTDVIIETIEDIQATTKRHTIIYKGPKHVSVVGDKQRIWQVIANLLNNAIKYSPRGGIIRVSLQRKPHNIIVSVKDYGIGIDKKSQKYIFNRYFREEGNNQIQFSGLGLGLFLAQQIIYLHKGKIWVRSNPQKGSTFYFSLPLHKNIR